MRALRIIVNGIELDYVREDLKVREENPSFFESIKAAHTTQPIRIKENTAAISALGAFSIASARKRKYFPCIVVRGAIRYNGVLTQIEQIKGFRKCDLKYGSEINGIMDKKIASFFPNYNVKGEQDVPFEEESTANHNAVMEWVNHALDLENKIFPEVKWQVPQMRYKDKFGTDLKEDDSHFAYKGYINNRMFEQLWPNINTTTEDVNVVFNTNVIAPQVFMLSPLFYAFSSIGYTLQGNVITSGFFKRLLLLSFNDNMTKIVKRVTGTSLSMGLIPWSQTTIKGILSGGLPFPTYVKVMNHEMLSAGSYRVVFSLNMEVPANEFLPFGIQIKWNNEIQGNFLRNKSGFYEETLSFTVEEGQQFNDVSIIYHSFYRRMPELYAIEIIKDIPDKDFYDTHPTIDFSRYIPDWSVAEYLNNFQNLFNWKFDINDVEKSISINYNAQDYLINGNIEVILKSLQITAIKNIEAESYVLKYANNEDSYMFISQDLEEVDKEKDENTKELITKFKYIPHQGGAAALSEKVEDKEGVGLLIYDPVNRPFTSPSFQGRNLMITGEGGIFETDWRKWLLFRLNSGNVVLKGPFTQTELFKITTKKKLFIDNQLWLLKALEYKENATALFETELELESVTF